MSQIVVDAHEATLIKTAPRMVQVVDREGKLVGYVTPAPNDQELEKWRQRMTVDEPTCTTEEVLDYLRSLPDQ